MFSVVENISFILEKISDQSEFLLILKSFFNFSSISFWEKPDNLLKLLLNYDNSSENWETNIS